MSIHKWRRLPNRNLGEVWVPVAQIMLFGVDGRSQAFLFQIDSGAGISLLARSAAEVLGIDLSSGRPIELSSVGGAATKAHVHPISTVFSRDVVIPVQYAVAEHENVPTLLGWKDVFDNLRVEFDPILKQTQIIAS